MDIDKLEDSINDSSSESIDEKIYRVFGRLAIDKRRLSASQLQKRGVPAYVGEWLLDSVIPGKGVLSSEEVTKVHDWAEKYIPRPDDSNIIKNRLLNGKRLKFSLLYK